MIVLSHILLTTAIARFFSLNVLHGVFMNHVPPALVRVTRRPVFSNTKSSYSFGSIHDEPNENSMRCAGMVIGITPSRALIFASYLPSALFSCAICNFSRTFPERYLYDTSIVPVDGFSKPSPLDTISRFTSSVGLPRAWPIYSTSTPPLLYRLARIASLMVVGCGSFSVSITRWLKMSVLPTLTTLLPFLSPFSE